MDSDILRFLPESDKEASILWTPQYNKARKLLYNNSVPKIEEALSLLEKETGTGNVLALDALARIYEQGIYVEGALDVAKEYYSKALSSFQSYIGNPILKAILSAHLDDTDAYFYFRLVNYYEHGLGVDWNIDAAISHYKKVAGNPYADYALSNLYLYDQNPEGAMARQATLKKCALLYKRAADHGHGPAAYAYAQLAEKETTPVYYRSRLKNIIRLPFPFMIMRHHPPQPRIPTSIGLGLCIIQERALQPIRRKLINSSKKQHQPIILSLNMRWGKRMQIRLLPIIIPNAQPSCFQRLPIRETALLTRSWENYIC